MCFQVYILNDSIAEVDQSFTLALQSATPDVFTVAENEGTTTVLIIDEGWSVKEVTYYSIVYSYTGTLMHCYACVCNNLIMYNYIFDIVYFIVMVNFCNTFFWNFCSIEALEMQGNVYAKLLS